LYWEFALGVSLAIGDMRLGTDSLLAGVGELETTERLEDIHMAGLEADPSLGWPLEDWLMFMDILPGDVEILCLVEKN
jgi:hypothetical protein